MNNAIFTVACIRLKTHWILDIKEGIKIYLQNLKVALVIAVQPSSKLLNCYLTPPSQSI